jgi:hypothetical protein
MGPEGGRGVVPFGTSRVQAPGTDESLAVVSEELS